ncbi:MAG: PH domain-containing protein [Ferruginibacter sp.]
MEFSNTQIEIRGLPAIEHVTFRSLEKEYLTVSRISFVISFLVILVIGLVLFFLIDRFRTPVLIYSSAAVFIFLSVLSWVTTTISFKYSGYAIREKDILFRHGWFICKTRVAPLKRVQHVSVQSGPIERKFGLASISIYTAGSDEADLTIRGINTETAQQIKEWLTSQMNGELNR